MEKGHGALQEIRVFLHERMPLWMDNYRAAGRGSISNMQMRLVQCWEQPYGTVLQV